MKSALQRNLYFCIEPNQIVRTNNSNIIRVVWMLLLERLTSYWVSNTEPPYGVMVEIKLTFSGTNGRLWKHIQIKWVKGGVSSIPWKRAIVEISTGLPRCIGRFSLSQMQWNLSYDKIFGLEQLSYYNEFCAAGSLLPRTGSLTEWNSISKMFATITRNEANEVPSTQD